jgi:hypothetical protein
MGEHEREKGGGIRILLAPQINEMQVRFYLFYPSNELFSNWSVVV